MISKWYNVIICNSLLDVNRVFISLLVKTNRENMLENKSNEYLVLNRVICYI